ncbi:PREDICTED: LOW QUALITY PROTEIN: odorant receptor 9a-like [Atta colombica]|uniref:LOW QUALITY PROTEIN: odorant receptor 9a-like n=1 Tax=Atta colombica TaxID=520822 RepID=UPI00084BF71D|nr:PREDICTED: LOW QUALITY PROTEIN: odorant receptor 9a-like [Atta colombica]
MKKYATNAKLITFAYLIYVFSCCGGYTLFSIIPKLLNIVLPLNESRPVNLPYQAYYFVDKDKYYFYIIFYVCVFASVATMMVIAHDCIFFIYIEHVCSLFAVTGFHLETLSFNNHNDTNNHLDDRKIYNRKIAISIHAHWRALRFADILDDIFCTAFAIQMSIVTVTLSITLLQIALLYGEINETLKYLAFIFAQVIHTFCFSIQGQRLIDHSSQLSNKIYNSSWYEVPTESRRLLLFMMRRSVQPCFLSAGKIYVFSLKSFSTVNVIYEIYVFTKFMLLYAPMKFLLRILALILKVMQSSVSYFTVLASFQ